MDKYAESHLDRNASPFNRAWYTPKRSHSQVNGQTRQAQDLIILHNDVVKRNKR